MNRPHVPTAVWAARQTVQALDKAERALVTAAGATDDGLIADAVDKARKKIVPARRRAAKILKDVDLKHARQLELEP